MKTSEQRRIAAETPVDTDARLCQARLSQQQRIAAETQEETEARLCQARLSQQRRIAAETPEETEARLCQARLSQQQRIVSEMLEETLARRYQDQLNHQQHTRHLCSSALSLLHQPAVTAKMNRFHSGIAALQVSTCVTCMERFPGMTVRVTSAGTECVRCAQDKHIPKTYSYENNMHAGTVPQDLTVSKSFSPYICYY